MCGGVIVAVVTGSDGRLGRPRLDRSDWEMPCEMEEMVFIVELSPSEMIHGGGFAHIVVL